MMSRFVIPHNMMHQLGQFSDRKHLIDGPLNLCIAGPKVETLHQFKNAVNSIEKEIISAHSGYPGEARTSILELQLPVESVVNLKPEELVRALEAVVSSAAESRILPHRVYFELPVEARNEETTKKIIKVISVHNRSILKRKIKNYLFSGIKINCGSLDVKRPPTAHYLSEVMLFARDANVAVKISGDINSAFPTYNYEHQKNVHGFINVVLGGLLGYTQDLLVDELKEVIQEKLPERFSFKNEYLAWQDLAAPQAEVKMLRMLSLTSFNTLDPKFILDQLEELHLL